MLLLNECNSVLVIGNHLRIKLLIRRKAMIWGRVFGWSSRIGSDYWVSWRWPRSFVWSFGKLNDGSPRPTWHLAQLKDQNIILTLRVPSMINGNETQFQFIISTLIALCVQVVVSLMTWAGFCGLPNEPLLPPASCRGQLVTRSQPFFLSLFSFGLRKQEAGGSFLRLFRVVLTKTSVSR